MTECWQTSFLRQKNCATPVAEHGSSSNNSSSNTKLCLPKPGKQESVHHGEPRSAWNIDQRQLMRTGCYQVPETKNKKSKTEASKTKWIKKTNVSIFAKHQFALSIFALLVVSEYIQYVVSSNWIRKCITLSVKNVLCSLENIRVL